MSQLFAIGLMSGTSMDGIDAALIQTNGQGEVLSVGNLSLDYDVPFKIILKAFEWVTNVCRGDLVEVNKHFIQLIGTYLDEHLKLDNSLQKIDELTDYCKKSGMDSLSVSSIIQFSTDLHARLTEKLIQHCGKTPDIIGYHGQTIYHNPIAKKSLQIGNGQYVADLLNIPVVTHFRNNDLAHGGQGAPLAPIYHQVLARRDCDLPAAIVNCGGIANVTFVIGNAETDLSAFDIGPGNALVDRFVRKKTKGKMSMDFNGNFGRLGKVNKVLLELLQEKAVSQNKINYLTKKPPKSLDTYDLTLPEEFDPINLEDGCRTLEAFTADTILQSLEHMGHIDLNEWVLTGGGWKNPVIKHEFLERVIQVNRNIKVSEAHTKNWKNEAIEAELFAYLAVRTFKGYPITFPTTTGVTKSLTGGQIVHPQGSF